MDVFAGCASVYHPVVYADTTEFLKNYQKNISQNILVWFYFCLSVPHLPVQIRSFSYFELLK